MHVGAPPMCEEPSEVCHLVLEEVEILFAGHLDAHVFARARHEKPEKQCNGLGLEAHDGGPCSRHLHALLDGHDMLLPLGVDVGS